ncbi:MAG: DUF547 domain-containing protein, partial [Planctomycetota bacterium]|nr:DUF547 domain-containing protein [Planctomycetota bacterium]
VPKSDHPKVLDLKVGHFPHELFDETLKDYNRGGFVDYGSLSTNRYSLNAYLAVIAKVSPRNSKDHFATPKHELAYWINAYNALIFQNILKRYPLRGLEGQILQTTFFKTEEFIVGGEAMSLDGMEDEVIKPGFSDPRVHFVMNKGCVSCPTLPEEAFLPEKLEEQLQREVKKFVMEERNVKIKARKGQLVLSPIFRDYRDEIVNHVSVKGQGSEDARLIAWINRYRAKDRKIPRLSEDWDIKYKDFDWSLNDRVGEGESSE